MTVTLLVCGLCGDGPPGHSPTPAIMLHYALIGCIAASVLHMLLAP